MKIFLSIIFVLFYNFCQAQKIQDTNYVIIKGTNYEVGNILPGSTYKVIDTSSKSMTPYEKDAIKELLLFYVEKTLYNLDDSKLNLKDQYNYLWGSDFYPTFKNELDELKNYLLGIASSTKKLKFVPSSDQIETFLAKNQFLIHSILNNPKDKLYRINVYKVNLYKQWILELYKQTWEDDTFKNIKADFAYTKAWRDMEDWMSKTNQLASVISQLQNGKPNLCDADLIQEIRKHLLFDPKKVTAFNILQKSFFKKMAVVQSGNCTYKPTIH